MRLKYIMVTHWDYHWDKLNKNETYYTKGMLRGKMSIDKIKENTPTIFIKINRQTRKPEKAWEGSVYGFRVEGNKIYFKVRIDREIDVPSKYAGYSSGWYAESTEEEIPFEAVYYPPFFYILNATNDYKEFEKYVHDLLKLLGIHQVFKFEKQRGQPDGFFKFGNLAVIYDATLESSFEETKKAQIDNYCRQLKAGSITYMNETIEISHCSKHVWIITRGEPRVLRKIDIIVKEVPVSELIKVYRKRIEENLNETELETTLRNICET